MKRLVIVLIILSNSFFFLGCDSRMSFEDFAEKFKDFSSEGLMPTDEKAKEKYLKSLYTTLSEITTIVDSTSETKPISEDIARKYIMNFWGNLALNSNHVDNFHLITHVFNSSYVFDVTPFDNIIDSLKLDRKSARIRVYPCLKIVEKQPHQAYMSFVIIVDKKTVTGSVTSGELMMNMGRPAQIQYFIRDFIGPCPPFSNCTGKDLLTQNEWKGLYTMIGKTFK